MAESSAPKGAAGRAGATSKEGGEHGGVHMPRVPMPSVPMPSVPVPGLRMPSGTAGHLLWWGGLAAVAAFGVVDWPVAALVGIGSWVAEQYAKPAQRPGGNGQAAS